MRIRYYVKRIAAGRYRDTRTGRFVPRATAIRSRAAQRAAAERAARIAAERERRSEAARRGWETRRIRIAQRAAEKAERIAAAKRGWETRRARIEAERRSEAARRGWETRRARERGWEPGRAIPPPTVTNAPWSTYEYQWQIASWEIRVAWDDIYRFVRRGLALLHVPQKALVTVRVQVAGEWISLCPYSERKAAEYDVRTARGRLLEKPSQKWEELDEEGIDYTEQVIEVVEIVWGFNPSTKSSR